MVKSMNTSLIMYDIDNFLEKYTRFMTKDIYISKDMYEGFLEGYKYLYKRLKKDELLYRENSKYKKMFNILNNKDKLLKLHNKKYLKKNIDKLDLLGDIDNNIRSIILSDEDKMLVISSKNNNTLISGKVKYLTEIKRIKKDKILVLLDDMNLYSSDLDDVVVSSIDEVINRFISGKRVISNDEKYRILFDYIVNVLFLDKDKMSKFYKAFSNYIYINKDYSKYDDFSSYNDYLYKRMFLSSKLSMNRFISKEIDNRKRYLRTIKNEEVNNLLEVEVANYLCLFGVSYKYLVSDDVFVVGDKNSFKLRIVDGEDNTFRKSFINLSSNCILDGSYKKILESDLKLRRINISNMIDKDIYEVLKKTIIDNYFREFINKYLIKYIDYYDINSSFSNIKLNDDEREVLEGIYSYYKEYLSNNNLVTNGDSSLLVSEFINNNKYKYVINKSNINLLGNFKVLQILDDYTEIDLIEQNIKLLYDYKKYLNDNKLLVGMNCFVDRIELSILTRSFLDSKIKDMNKYFPVMDKKIIIKTYDDSRRMLVNKMVAGDVYEVVRKNKNILIGLNNGSDINDLVYKNYLVKIGNNKLSIDGEREVVCEDILNIKNSYEKIILPLLVENYYEDKIDIYRDYRFKLMIYITLSKCKKELILLVPSSYEKEVKKIIKKIC